MPNQQQVTQKTARPIKPKTFEPVHPTFSDHLRELRRRLFVAAFVLVGGVLLGYALHDKLAHILLSPLHGEKLIYLTPGGGFDFIFKISLYFGIVLAIPLFIYQIYKYLSPAMKQPSRKAVAGVVLLSAVLAAAGILFGYFVAVPSALNFLTGFAAEYVEASLTASSYLDFVTLYMLGLALLFQIPLILLIINSVSGPLTPSQLLKSEQWVLLGTFVAAAIITPTPDIVNQSVIAAPILGVYQLGIAMVIIQNKKTARLGQEPEIEIPVPQQILEELDVTETEPLAKAKVTQPQKLVATAAPHVPQQVKAQPVRIKQMKTPVHHTSVQGVRPQHMDMIMPAARPRNLVVPQRSITQRMPHAAPRQLGRSIDGMLA